MSMLNYKVTSLTGLLVAVALVIAAAVLFPFAVIWSLNTLFPVLSIAYSIDTWAAVIIFQMFFKANIVSATKKDNK